MPGGDGRAEATVHQCLLFAGCHDYLALGDFGQRTGFARIHAEARAAHGGTGIGCVNDETGGVAARGLYGVGDAATLQAQVGVDHAALAIAAHAVQVQFAVFFQQQTRAIGEFQAQAGPFAGAQQGADSQLHSFTDHAGDGAAQTFHAGLAFDCQHLGLGRLHAQPCQRKTQGGAGWQRIGVGDLVMRLQLLPGDVWLQVFT